ncbi:hypothetical protein GIB67_029477 [Kingdonia uniflora]|uniref:Uncharacterized protein n=1 Tax=Kingdonia uniflora TaxID=39325 RepID=A0A7J7NY03_9MAGN|nr:hypothetical protein GIB67_029477 [Kingdonia uniflora]
MMALCVVAFAISGYASTEGRNCKLFNPLLEETYEADYPDKGVRFFSEKVSHHPVIVACHYEGKGCKFWGDSNLKSKFWGRSIQLDPVGILTLEFDDGEVFQWSKVTTSIYNLILGKVYCDHYCTMRIQGNRDYSCKLKFKEQSIIDRNPHQVQGIVQDKSGKTMATLFGKWDESMHYAAVYALLIAAIEARFTSCDEERNDPSKVHIVLSPKLNLLLDSIETQLNTRKPKLVTRFKMVKLPNLALYFIPLFKKSSEYGRSGVAEVIHSLCFCAAVDKLAERVSCPRFTLSIPEIMGEFMDLSYSLVSMDRLHSLASKAGVEQEFLAHFGSKILAEEMEWLDFYAAVPGISRQSGGLDTDRNQLPRLVYVSREKRPRHNHHKKAGAMNALTESIKVGMWDGLYDAFHSIGQHICTSPPSSYAELETIEIEPPCKRYASQQSSLHKLNVSDVAVVDISKSIAAYFEHETSITREAKSPFKTQLSCWKKLCDCELWLTEKFLVNNFDSLGYGEFL